MDKIPIPWKSSSHEEIIRAKNVPNPWQGILNQNTKLLGLDKSFPPDVQKECSLTAISQTATGVPHIAASSSHEVAVSTTKRPMITPLMSPPLCKLQKLNNTNMQDTSIERKTSRKYLNDIHRTRNIKICKMALYNTIDKIERAKHYQCLVNYYPSTNLASYLFGEMVYDNKKGLPITDYCHICDRPYKIKRLSLAKHLIVDHNVNFYLRNSDKKMVMDLFSETDSPKENSCQTQKVNMSNTKQDIVNSSFNCYKKNSTNKSDDIKEKTVMANSTKKNQLKASEITHAVLSFITKTNQPFNIVESNEFHTLMRVSAPLYQIPNKQAITKMFEDKYKSLSNIVKDELKNTNGICITTDTSIEINNLKIVLGLTAHYIIDENLKSVTIGVKMFRNTDTPQYIENTLRNIFLEWNIEEKDVIAIIRNTEPNGIIQQRHVATISTIDKNISKAIENLFRPEKVLQCFTYILNFIPSTIIERMDKKNTFIFQLINKVRDIVIYFKISYNENKRLNFLTNESLILDDKRQWNSCYDMLRQFLSIDDKVSKVLQTSRKSLMLKKFELSIIKDFVDLLEPFAHINDIISKKKYYPGSQIIPLVKDLECKLETLKPHSEYGSSLKKHFLEEFDKSFRFTEQFSLLGMATLLDPRFKMLHFRSISNASNNIERIAKLLKTMVNNDNTETKNDWNYINKLKTAPTKNIDGIPEELRQYLNSNVVDKETNPIEFWQKQQQSTLSKIAIRYLTVRATTAQLEETRNIIDSTISHYKKLLFLNSLTTQNNYF